ncbi:MAG: D-alanyl-D-alanine carboxypeptidase [Clostridia bacterium]|nr:D-alanyl-D-alanine carboxypeptidase [Clostridia bacterium]
MRSVIVRMKRHKRQCIALFFLLLMCSPFGALPAQAAFSKTEATEIYKKTKVDALTAKSYAAVEYESGQLILHGGTQEPVVIGGLVKMMTLLLTFEAVASGQITLDTEFTVTKHAQNVSVGKARVFLDAGKRERITVRQAVEAVCISGANDAACALAEFIGGDEATFVARMNARAGEMGLTNTHFTDSTGLKTDQSTTALDFVKIVHALMRNHPESLPFLNMTYGKFQHTSTGQPDTEMVSYNPLNRNKFYEASDGGMIGSSQQDGYSICATVSESDQRVVGVILGAPDENTRAAEIRRLLEYSVSEYEFRKLCTGGMFVRKVEVKNGKEKRIKTQTATELSVLVHISEVDKITSSVEITEKLSAPVEAGTKVGYVIYSMNDKEIGRVELVTSEEMPKANWFVRFVRMILSWFGL